MFSLLKFRGQRSISQNGDCEGRKIFVCKMVHSGVVVTLKSTEMHHQPDLFILGNFQLHWTLRCGTCAATLFPAVMQQDQIKSRCAFPGPSCLRECLQVELIACRSAIFLEPLTLNTSQLPDTTLISRNTFSL